MKKFLAILLSLIMVIGLVTGCGNTEGGQENTGILEAIPVAAGVKNSACFNPEAFPRGRGATGAGISVFSHKI